MFQKIHDTGQILKKDVPSRKGSAASIPELIPEWLKYTEYLEIHHPYLLQPGYPEEPLVANEGPHEFDNPLMRSNTKRGVWERRGQGRHGMDLALLIISISLAAFMTALDGTIVNIALPTISEAFDVSTSTVSAGIDNLPARHLGVHPDLREGLRRDRVPEGLPLGIPAFFRGIAVLRAPSRVTRVIPRPDRFAGRSRR